MTAPTPGSTLLLVEDDPAIRRALSLALADQGMTVREADSGESGLRALATADDIDLVVLDVMLPGIDGIEVCRRIRAEGMTPVIMVTARGMSVDVVAGLEAGADDYVVKPVVASELAARVRALLRRVAPAEQAAPRTLRAGDVVVDVGRGRVERAGAEVHLTRTEFRLLSELIAAAGRVVTREQLLERVWRYDYFGDTRLLDVHVRRLRRKVERDPDRPALIVTVRGSGYRIDTP